MLVFYCIVYLPGVFADSLAPALDAYGLDGTFRVKERQHEGLATFYRRLASPTTTPHPLIGCLSMASIILDSDGHVMVGFQVTAASVESS